MSDATTRNESSRSRPAGGLPAGQQEQVVEGDPAASVAPVRKHLYEVDILRILTFVCVISVHVVSHAAPSTSIPQNGWLILTHFTREVFFALTAFVLIYSYDTKPRPMRQFWPRRFLLVIVPYVSWSAIYRFTSWVRYPPLHWDWSVIPTFWQDLYEGTAWYHLYFLLVTMQVYLLLPALVWLVRKTRGHHVLLLALSLVFQLLLTFSYHYAHSFTAPWNKYSSIEFWSYWLLIIAGAVAADHRGPLLAWVRSHRLTILWIVVAGAVLDLGVYALNLALGENPVTASTALQPVVMIWSFPVALGFLAIGTRWADQRVPGSRMARLVDTASDRSFGIFLAHPYLIYWLQIGAALASIRIPSPWLSFALYFAVVICTVALIEIVRRTPLSLALTGRPFVSPRKKRERAAARAAADAERKTAPSTP